MPSNPESTSADATTEQDTSTSTAEEVTLAAPESAPASESATSDAGPEAQTSDAPSSEVAEEAPAEVEPPRVFDSEISGTDGQARAFLTGTAGDDLIQTGNVGDAIVKAGDGNDVIISQLNGDVASPFGPTFNREILNGGNGDDEIYGARATGSNFIFGQLEGGNGDDLIVGGTGNDLIRGGAGNDTFRFLTDNGVDVITDFQSGVDRVEIDIEGVTSLADATVSQGADGVFGFLPVTSYDFGNGDVLQVQGGALTDADVDFV